MIRIRQWFQHIILGLAVFFLAATIILGALYLRPGTAQDGDLVYIPPGVGLNQIASRLFDLGAIRSPDEFKLFAKLSGHAGRLRAGEYELVKGASLREIISTLRFNPPHQRYLTVAEGTTVLGLSALLEASPGIDVSSGFDIAEGSFLPETYAYSYGETASEVVQRMQQAMMKVLDRYWADRSDGLPIKNKAEALVLASIVEKETGLAGERGPVAAVFINRLRAGMRLQSDPTVIYGITGGLSLGRSLKRSELKKTTAYNTYRINGLPPTPIASPGRSSIAAVLNPPNLPYYYFVADGTGGHAFATTLDKHNKNVARWRRIEQDRQTVNSDQSNRVK